MDVLNKIRSLVSLRLGILRAPFQNVGGNAWVAHVASTGGDDNVDRFRSALALYEGDIRLTTAHQHIDVITLVGMGRYAHWHDAVIFSTTDNSDPNTNGRTYSFDFSMSLEEWERERISRQTHRWLTHSEGRRFLDLGGDRVPPPLIANLGLTNKCNLRCEICGSQKFLDETGIRRRHMAYPTFEAVAETLFPVLTQVELNSQGDPLLHPRIEDVLAMIEKHRCEVKIQHNGTLLSDTVIDVLLRHYGTIMLSLDAVGERLDEVRAGASWNKAKPGLDRLLRERDPKKLAIGVYPTLTKRTIGDAVDVARWAIEKDVDHVVYHRYNPIQNSFEEAPSDADYEELRDRLRRWCDATGDRVRVQFEGEMLNAGDLKERRVSFPDLEKHAALCESSKVMFPISRSKPGYDPFATCASPDEYVEVGLDGQVSACCRSQDVALGSATTVDKFAAAWFGRNYQLIRKSLRRDADGPYPLPNCEGCVKFFAPDEARARVAVDYRAPLGAKEMRLRSENEDVVPVEAIQKEAGFCHIVSFPVGLESDDYVLYEDETPLGPGSALHAEIRAGGRGRYHLGETTLHFSSSDGSDARRNGRIYSLRRRACLKSAPQGDEIAL